MFSTNDCNSYALRIRLCIMLSPSYKSLNLISFVVLVMRTSKLQAIRNAHGIHAENLSHHYTGFISDRLYKSLIGSNHVITTELNVLSYS